MEPNKKICAVCYRHFGLEWNEYEWDSIGGDATGDTRWCPVANNTRHIKYLNEETGVPNTCNFKLEQIVMNQTKS